MENKRLTKKDWQKKVSLDRRAFLTLVRKYEEEIKNMPEADPVAVKAYNEYISREVYDDEAIEAQEDPWEDWQWDDAQDEAFDALLNNNGQEVLEKEKEHRFPSWMMSLQFLDRLKVSIPTSHVVATRVPLRKQTNGQEYYGLSPFKPESTPSFFVNDRKGKWFDFSIGYAGDSFDFVQRVHGYSFVQSVLYVMKLAKYPVPKKDEGLDEYLKRRETILRHRRFTLKKKKWDRF